MKARKSLIVLSSLILLIGCDAAGSSSSVSTSSVSSFVSSVSPSVSSVTSEGDGVIYMNPIAERLDRALTKTKNQLRSVLSTEDLFSVKAHSSGTSEYRMDGKLATRAEGSTENSTVTDYSNVQTVVSSDQLEVNYDVKAAKSASQSDWNSIIGGILSNDRTEMYIHREDQIENTVQTAHSQDRTAESLIYYADADFYYDINDISEFLGSSSDKIPTDGLVDFILGNFGDYTDRLPSDWQDHIPSNIPQKGKIENFNFNRVFGKKILSYRDEIVQILSYDSVSDWTQEERDATYLDEIIILYKYFITENVYTNSEALDALIALMEPLEEQFSFSLNINDENRIAYEFFLAYLKSCSFQFMIFSETETTCSVTIDMEALIDFLMRNIDAALRNPDSFGIEESDIEMLQDLYDRLSASDSNNYAFDITFDLGKSEILQGYTYHLQYFEEDATVLMATYEETEDDGTATTYNEYYLGPLTVTSESSSEFFFDDDKILISKPDLSDYEKVTLN